jgi:putative nucleotidyltransferase-like protein
VATHTDALRETARSLSLDLATAEVVSALRHAGIRSIVLKGPSIHRVLYKDGAPRPYRDSDLLVSPDDLTAAGAILRTLDFKHLTAGETPRTAHEQLWVRRRDRTNLELHWTLVGVEGEPAELWRMLGALTETMVVGGLEVEVLEPTAIAFQVALHAAQHGPARPQSITDLERALARLGQPTWRAATALAEALQATETFAAGLRLVPAGEALAANLELNTRKSVQLAVLSSSAPPMTTGLEQLSRTRGLWPKLSLLARELIPSRPFMRLWWPPAQRGGIWMLAAYLQRPFWLLARLGPALIAWRRAVGESRRSG